MNTQDTPANLKVQDAPGNVNIPEQPINIQEISNLSIQEQSTNEPIDMRNPMVKEKANTPLKQDSDSNDMNDKTCLLTSENNNSG